MCFWFCSRDGPLLPTFASNGIWVITVMDIMLACIILHNMVIEDELRQDLKPLVNLLVGMEVKYGLTFEVLM